ncbi:MAG: hypothetical protein ACREJN_11600 [Nitrospiraceae bacterium]
MRYAVMAILITLVGFDLSLAQTRDQQRESLRGLQGVEVVVEEIKPDAQADGLSQESIRTTVELILRSKGIRVLTQSERSEMPSKPYLYVSVGTDKQASGQYSFNARVELHQTVGLVYRPQHIMLAATWLAPGKLRTVAQQNIRLWVINSIEPLVRDFANDFRAVNPR